ncbi:uncharacterized protein PV09_01913 [Verruconis gallopava]|uniref:Uncharacterized protein n=1 Tax=Verruconis gallopava TaxID=253628 RepID=A0A0D2AJG4_9PEZI|nr:uncharacterized protein PV09_01913 [Verruconis gallopava]KIW07018.1 hypothetical protein PV09_01913 [Verruconis gallopava]
MPRSRRETDKRRSGVTGKLRWRAAEDYSAKGQEPTPPCWASPETEAETTARLSSAAQDGGPEVRTCGLDKHQVVEETGATQRLARGGGKVLTAARTPG